MIHATQGKLNLSPCPLGRYLPAKKSTTAPAAGEIGSDII